jgi:glyoxylase-like metal-dependent hydrolase (beta-lactamase superfamily II)
VDPGDETHAILDRLQHHKVRVRALWHTHAHIDHVGATKALLEVCGTQNAEEGRPPPVVYLHEGDRFLYENIPMQAKFLGIRPFDVPATFEPLKDQQSYEGFPKLRSHHTPGHTPGSCCLEITAPCDLESPRSFGQAPSGARLLLSGDTLFRRGIGRTDLWGGDGQLIEKSIRKRLYTLAPNTVVVPGHGPLTTVEEEAEKNPFVKKV